MLTELELYLLKPIAQMHFVDGKTTRLPNMLIPAPCKTIFQTCQACKAQPVVCRA